MNHHNTTTTTVTNRWWSGFFVLTTFVSMQSVNASEAMLTKNNCAACHQAERKMVGPSYKDVAAKYKGQAAAVDQLAKKIRVGGAGNWGAMPMPAYPQLSEADATALAVYILNVK